jgi:hypothetical protein
MVRMLFRGLGLLILAGAFCAVLYDGTRAIADGELRTTALRAVWAGIDSGGLSATQAKIEGAAPWAWALINSLLGIPAVLALAILGIGLSLLGRKPNYPSSYWR